MSKRAGGGGRDELTVDDEDAQGGAIKLLRRSTEAFDSRITHSKTVQVMVGEEETRSKERGVQPPRCQKGTAAVARGVLLLDPKPLALKERWELQCRLLLDRLCSRRPSRSLCCSSSLASSPSRLTNSSSAQQLPMHSASRRWDSRSCETLVSSSSAKASEEQSSFVGASTRRARSPADAPLHHSGADPTRQRRRKHSSPKPSSSQPSSPPSFPSSSSSTRPSAPPPLSRSSSTRQPPSTPSPPSSSSWPSGGTSKRCWTGSRSRACA